MPNVKILVVDDDIHLQRALAELLRSRGYVVTCAGSTEEALERCRHETFHLALCDLQLPGRNGLSLVKALHDACPQTQPILITGHGSIRTAVTALKRGAVEYITKPIKPKRLLALIAALTSDLPPFLPNRLLPDDKLEVVRWGELVGRSRALRDTVDRLRRAAAADTPLVLVGESGAGKETAARAVHAASSRNGGPFVVVTTSVLPADQVALEIFGGEKADKREAKLDAAEGGTLFIDEIVGLDDRVQAQLLRLIESGRAARAGTKRERAVSVRLLFSSTSDLAQAVQAGKLRADLHHRISAAVVALPPLRERPEDVPVIAEEIVRGLAERHAKPVRTIASDAQRLLSGYGWPGNLRELRNVLEQAVVLARGEALDAQLLPQMLHREPRRETVLRIPVGAAMGNIEKEVILRTLEAHRGNKTAAAAALGISRRSIYNKLAAYGIT